MKDTCQLSRARFCVQLLQVALQEERPELEERRQALLHEADTLRLQLSDLDTRLLDLLLSGDFLHNQELRQALQACEQTCWPRAQLTE